MQLSLAEGWWELIEQQEEKIVGCKTNPRKLFDAAKERELVERCMEGAVCKSRNNVSGSNVTLRKNRSSSSTDRQLRVIKETCPGRGLDRSNPVLLHYAPRVGKSGTELNKARGSTEGNC